MNRQKLQGFFALNPLEPSMKKSVAAVSVPPKKSDPGSKKSVKSTPAPVPILLNSSSDSSGFDDQEPADKIVPSPVVVNNNKDTSLAGKGKKFKLIKTEEKTNLDEVQPLPIELPDSVTDAEAFRRYLSVRRGGISLSNAFSPEFVARPQVLL